MRAAPRTARLPTAPAWASWTRLATTSRGARDPRPGGARTAESLPRLPPSCQRAAGKRHNEEQRTLRIACSPAVRPQLSQEVELAGILVVDVALAAQAARARDEPAAVVELRPLVEVEGKLDRGPRCLQRVHIDEGRHARRPAAFDGIGARRPHTPTGDVPS
eukprot:5728821-Prymnesium_polylepis.1